jgi:hypothetical protein
VTLTLLKDFQTLFVGVLGFTGVILTMVVNAKIQRSLQSAQRKHDTQSLRIALLVELQENIQMYQARVEDLANTDAVHHALLPSRLANSIFQSSLAKVGLLSTNEVEKVLRAYLLLEELPYRLRLLVGTSNVGGYEDEFIRIDGDRQLVAKQIHEALLPTLREAVAALKSNA